MNDSVRTTLLVRIADLRSGLLYAASGAPVANRVNRFCDALAAWGALPNNGRDHYGRPVLECLFDLVADLEDDFEIEDLERMTVELSLWDVATELRLDDVDTRRGEFITRRRSRLLRTLEAAAKSGVERLLYKWAALLRPRTETVHQLPGPFRDDISAVVDELVHAGLPRRARALATKFHLPVNPLVRWTIEHRPESEELGRTTKLLQRVAAPPRPVPYRVRVCGRAMYRVLSASVAAIPMTVSGSGCITVDGRTYGVTTRR